MSILAVFKVNEQRSGSVFKKADLHFDAGEYHKAVSGFKAAIGLEHGLHDALKGSAQKADKRKKQERNMARTLTKMGHALMEHGRGQKSGRRQLFLEARDCFKQALNLWPDYNEAKTMLVKINGQLGKTDSD